MVRRLRPKCMRRRNLAGVYFRRTYWVQRPPCSENPGGGGDQKRLENIAMESNCPTNARTCFWQRIALPCTRGFSNALGSVKSKNHLARPAAPSGLWATRSGPAARLRLPSRATQHPACRRPTRLVPHVYRQGVLLGQRRKAAVRHRPRDLIAGRLSNWTLPCAASSVLPVPATIYGAPQSPDLIARPRLAGPREGSRLGYPNRMQR